PCGRVISRFTHILRCSKVLVTYILKLVYNRALFSGTVGVSLIYAYLW
ncbi:MAG: hypothetical protein ACI909_001343, partial [Planctomycetota bacterium]